MPTYSVVIPCFRTTGSILDYLREIDSFFISKGLEHETICVIDGPNAVDLLLLEQIRNLDFVKVIILSRNFGQHAATLAGLQHSNGEWIVTVDDDGQHPVSEFGKILFDLDFYDVNYGIPLQLPNKRLKNISSSVNKSILRKVLGNSDRVQVSAFRIFRRSLIINNGDSHFSDYVLDVDLIWATSRIKNTVVEFSPRLAGKSNYNFTSLMRLAIPLWLGFSRLPLRIFTFAGVFTLLINLILFSYFTYRKLFNGIEVSGFYALSSLVLFTSSVLIVGIGILGEYLVQAYETLRRKPSYRVVEEKRST